MKSIQTDDLIDSCNLDKSRKQEILMMMKKKRKHNNNNQSNDFKFVLYTL